MLCAAGRLLAQCPDGTPAPCGGPPARPRAPAANSVAVLPFASRSPDTTDAYLAEGLTDEVGNRLTQLGRLQVKARGVVEAQWRRDPDPLAAARALGVAWFVHGNVRHAAGQLLVNVELVRTATGEQTWASRFTRRDADLFAVQAEMAESAAAVVGGRLNPTERAALARRPTVSNEAYRLYLLGNSLLGRRTQLDVRRALEAYTAATRLDPRFVAAWARIGLARLIEWSWPIWHEDVPGDSLRVLGRVAAQRALSLDPLSAEAWLATAYAAVSAGDLWVADAGFARSLALDSLNPEAWHLYGVLYGADCPAGGCLGDYARAVPLLRHALALDPTLRNTWRHLAWVMMGVGRLAEAEAMLDTALAFGAWPPALLMRADIRFARGNARSALADVEEAERLDSVPEVGRRARYAIELGDSAAARAWLAGLHTRADSGRADYGDIARFSMALGLKDEALGALERLRAAPDSSDEPRCAPVTPCSVSVRTWLWLHDPGFASLHGDPRFERLWAETQPRIPWEH